LKRPACRTTGMLGVCYRRCWMVGSTKLCSYFTFTASRFLGYASNCNQWWGCTSGFLQFWEGLECTFSPITPTSILGPSVSPWQASSHRPYSLSFGALNSSGMQGIQCRCRWPGGRWGVFIYHQVLQMNQSPNVLTTAFLGNIFRGFEVWSTG